MKKFFLIPLLILGSKAVTAQSAAVLQHNGTASSYYGNAALQLAYTAAVNGDTIYLPGGFFAPPASFDKKLMIIGAGHHPDSSAATLTTVISGDIALGENSDGSFFSGFKLNGSITTGDNFSASNISITRVYINGAINMPGGRINPCINVLLKDCVLVGAINCPNSLQFVIANNIFLAVIYNIESSLITNNVFLGGDDTYNGMFRSIYNTNQCVIRNNIFFRPLFDFVGSTSNQVLNNIFTNTPPGMINNFFSGNYFNVTAADIFVSYVNDGFTYTNNYHLITPANYNGTDALQVGLYGSIKPWKEGSIPLNPHIQTKTIAENTDINGAIQVQVKVAAQNQ